MKKYFKFLLIGLFVALFIGTFVFLWNKTKTESVTYDIVSPKIETIQKSITATGKIEPRDEVLIKPQISGIISKVHKKAGELVHKNEIIATVKVIPEMGQLNNAESRVKLAKIKLAQIEKQHLRNVELYDKGVIAIEEYEKSETTLFEAQEELQSANDNLEIIKTGITKNNASISNTQIRATIDGMILDVPVKKGNSVIQANTFNDGTTIASIADMSDIIFKGKVDETDVNRLKEKMSANVRIGAMQGVNLDAILEYISPKAVEENNINMFEVKIAVTVPDSIKIRAGYSANADVITEQRKDVLCIPESTIEFKEDKKIVHILTSKEDDKEQVFEEREIETGISDGINIEIIKGLTAEDKIRN